MRHVIVQTDGCWIDTKIIDVATGKMINHIVRADIVIEVDKKTEIALGFMAPKGEPEAEGHLNKVKDGLVGWVEIVEVDKIMPIIPLKPEV